MKKLGIPVVVEPGSQPADEDGVVLDYMPMPKEVWTYAMPVVPEPEDVEVELSRQPDSKEMLLQLNIRLNPDG